jgi:predicted GNAT family acetyltransferase
MEKDYRIQEALPGDAGLVAHFCFQVFEEQYDLSSVHRGLVFCALHWNIWKEVKQIECGSFFADDEVVGSICTIQQDEHTARLDLFAVSDSMQTTGLEAALFRTAVQCCKAQDWRHISLLTPAVCENVWNLCEEEGIAVKIKQRMINSS